MLEGGQVLWRQDGLDVFNLEDCFLATAITGTRHGFSMPGLHARRGLLPSRPPAHLGQAFRLCESSQTGPEQLVLDDKVERDGLLVPQHLVDELGQLESPPVAGHHVL